MKDRLLSMNGYRELMQQIAAKHGGSFRSASTDDLQRLAALRLPDSVVQFYATYEPATCIDTGDFRLWPLAQVFEENSDYVPGCWLAKNRLVVFATTIFGDAYCFDLNEALENPPIVLMSHEIYWDEMPSDQILLLRKRVANDLRDFLQKFRDEDLDVQPLFPPGK